MTLLSFKGYQGSVTYEGGRLIIQVLHVDDFVTTECVSAADAQSAFEALVEDYLQTCKEIGKEPSRPFKGSFNVRLTPAMHKSAAEAAARDGISLNAWVVHAIEHFLKDHSYSKTETYWNWVSEKNPRDILAILYEKRDKSMKLSSREWRTSEVSLGRMEDTWGLRNYVSRKSH